MGYFDNICVLVEFWVEDARGGRLVRGGLLRFKRLLAEVLSRVLLVLHLPRRRLRCLLLASHRGLLDQFYLEVRVLSLLGYEVCQLHMRSEFV